MDPIPSSRAPLRRAGERQRHSATCRATVTRPVHAGARLDSARLGSTRLGSARLGSARLGSTRLGSARLGSARLGSARLDSARLDSARLGSARLYSTRLNSTRLDPARLLTETYRRLDSFPRCIGRSTHPPRVRVRWLLQTQPFKRAVYTELSGAVSL